MHFHCSKSILCYRRYPFYFVYPLYKNGDTLYFRKHRIELTQIILIQ
jgi:hypothetical protein